MSAAKVVPAFVRPEIGTFLTDGRSLVQVIGSHPEAEGIVVEDCSDPRLTAEVSDAEAAGLRVVVPAKAA